MPRNEHQRLAAAKRLHWFRGKFVDFSTGKRGSSCEVEAVLTLEETKRLLSILFKDSEACESTHEPEAPLSTGTTSPADIAPLGSQELCPDDKHQWHSFNTEQVQGTVCTECGLMRDSAPGFLCKTCGKFHSGNLPGCPSDTQAAL